MERATISRQQQTQRAFLGAALMDPARAREYIIKLVPGMFDEGVSRAVFSAVQQLTMAGEPVDVITVINRASAGRPADEIRPGVVAMAETCPSVSNIGSYAAQILEDYRYSLLQGDLMKCMAKDAMDSDGVCRQLRRTLAVQDAIRSTQTDSTARDFDAVLDSALARLDEPDDSLKLGWPELDRYGVFGRQRVCVVAGRPGCGKTDFSLNLAARLSKRYKVYYLTLEETAEALMDRILSKVARIDSGKLTNKSLAPREREIINNAAARLRQHHNMMLDADSNLTIDGLEAKLMQYKPDIAFIDHIGLLTPTDPRQTEYQRVSEITRRLNTSKFFGVADYDRPCVSSVLLGVAMVRDAIVETAIPAVALLPCDMRMLKANREMIQDTGPRQFYLRNRLEPVEGKYDYCLMDCPPDLDMGSINALTAADWVIIPVDCDEWACDGMREIIDQIEQVQMYYNPHLKVMGALMTKYRRTRYAGEVVHQLNEAGIEMLHTVIRYTVKVSEAKSAHEPLRVYKPDCSAALDYGCLADEVDEAVSKMDTHKEG